MLIEKGRVGEVYNIGSGQGYAIKDLLNNLLTLTEETITIAQDPNRMRPSDVPVMIGDVSKIKEHIGWEPEIPIDKTLRDVLDYWRQTR